VPEIGERVTPMALGPGRIVTCVAAASTVSAIEVAVIVTTPGLGMLAGAVYKPLLLTIPAVADQVTRLSFVPVTVAVNCCVLDVLRFVLVVKS
jgi:hypothetical protein